MNPRYLCYCRANGHTSDEQMAVDSEHWPGGKMCGFMLWIAERLRQFKRLQPGAFLHGNLVEHAAFDSWLQIEVEP